MKEEALTSPWFLRPGKDGEKEEDEQRPETFSANEAMHNAPEHLLQRGLPTVSSKMMSQYMQLIEKFICSMYMSGPSALSPGFTCTCLMLQFYFRFYTVRIV